jgi:hypothetical protein
MVYTITLKFGNRYITRKENGTWDEIKAFYGSQAIRIKEYRDTKQGRNNKLVSAILTSPNSKN